MKQQSKTILEWFEEARAAGHEWADAAIENAWAFGSAERSTMHESAAAALSRAFVWHETRQGGDFWVAVHDSLLENP